MRPGGLLRLIEYSERGWYSMPAVRAHTMAYADEIDNTLSESNVKEFKVILGTEYMQNQWEATIVSAPAE